jgi:hypothetical protein
MWCRPLLSLLLSSATVCSAFSPNLFSRALHSTSTPQITLPQSTGFASRSLRIGSVKVLDHPKRVQRIRPQSLQSLKAMFTGIVEEMGKVSSLVADPKTGGGVELRIACKTALEGAYEGCSIAVNGVCLTVTAFDQQEFTVAPASRN